jgi:DNA invertase Pin-like site-specific DNA recombinase
MLSSITASHRERLACVYLRQSTIQQVRLHTESQRRQRDLADRARDLGWEPGQVLVIDEDLGRSAAVGTVDRPGYQRLLQRIVAGEVGLILAVEISRLAREDLAWAVMFRHCQFSGVLLADEEHVYDPADAHDRMMLGLLATFAGFELSLLRGRMVEAWRRKADRGELYCGCAPGYLVDGLRLVKTPDRQVRHVLEAVFAEFARQPSVGALCRWCCQHGVELPYCQDGQGRRIRWGEAAVQGLRRLLLNPVYAGAYVLGRSTTCEQLLPDGQIQKYKVRLALDQWPVLIRDHHEPYIAWEQFERNWHRLRARRPSTQGGAMRTVGRGEALLAGLLHCRRCGHGLYVRYSRQGAVRYLCLGGGKQREAHTKTCFSFAGQALDELVGRQLLEVVRPAGVEAALLAARELASRSERQRQVLADQVTGARYEADRARRQYEQVEPENRLVCAELERRWNQALSVLAAAEERLVEFDRQAPAPLTPGEQEDLLDLGRHLERVWFSPDSPVEVRKQIVRLLVERIVVDVVAENQLQVFIHWVGGHHSEHLVSRRPQVSSGDSADLVQTVDLLRQIAADEPIARMLNRAGIRTAHGASWTAARVAAFRQRHGIRGFDLHEKQRSGILRQDEAARQLGVSPMSVHRLLTSGVVPGRQARPGLPWLIEARALECEAVQAAVRAIRNDANAAPVDHPNQPTLW